MIHFCVSVLVLVVTGSAVRGAVELEQELGDIKELLQSSHSVEARARAQELLRLHPANPALQYLLAFSEAQDVEGDKMEAVRLALEVISQPEISTSLYGTAAKLALEAAHNSDNDSLIREASHQVIVRDSQRPLEDTPTRVLAVTLLGEQLLLKVRRQSVSQSVMLDVGQGEVERAEETVMSLGLTDHQDLGLGLLQLLVVLVRERRQGLAGGQRRESQEILHGLQPGDEQEMEDAKEMLKRIQDRWDRNRTSLATEYDEMMELMVMLGVYVSKYQRPGWCEDDPPLPSLTGDISGTRRSWRPSLCGGWRTWARLVTFCSTSRPGGRLSVLRPRG